MLRDVDHRSTVAGDHARADERAEAERTLEVDGDDLVEQLLAGLDEARVHGRHAGVVDEDVDVPELVVGGVA